MHIAERTAGQVGLTTLWPVPEPGFADMDTTGLVGGLIEYAHTEYDDGGNAIGLHTLELNHDKTSGILATSTFVRQTLYSWYDDADRLEAVADYGSSDGTSAAANEWKYVAAPSRPSTALDFSNADVKNGRILLTESDYNVDHGRRELVTQGVSLNGGAVVTIAVKTFYDDLGRRVHVAENHDNFDGTLAKIGDDGATGDDSLDRVTSWEYNGLGQVKKLIAYNGSSSDDQTTTYLYEDPDNASLVTNTIYPDSGDSDSTGTDQVKRTYNLDGSLATMTDQRGVVHTYSYNDRRQLLIDGATTIPTGVDTSIKSIERTYDDMGRVTNIRSRADDNGTGTVLNRINYVYYEAPATIKSGQLRFSYQYHDGGSGVNGQVKYQRDASADGNDAYQDGLRLYRIDYPNGAQLGFERGHGSPTGHSNNLDDRLSRITGLDFDPDGGGTAPNVDEVEYDYSGTNRLAEADYLTPDLRLAHHQHDSDDAYEAFDRFGRTIDHYWDGYGSTSDAERVKYGYDFAGNRTYRDIDSAIYSTNDKDKGYGYDGLHRLITYDAGTLSGSTISGTPTEEQDFTLDQLGNWENLTEKVSGTTVLDQDRTHNDANEIDDGSDNGITTTLWADPVHDDAGQHD